MRSEPSNPHGETRRQFIKKTGAAAAVASSGLLPSSLFAREGGGSIVIVLDPQDSIAKEAPVQWAVAELRDALVARGVAAQIKIQNDVASAGGTDCVLVASRQDAAKSPYLEVLAIGREKIGKRSVLLASGSNSSSLAYAVLELADRVKLNSDPLDAFRLDKPLIEGTNNSIRSVTRGFNSDVEDKPWFNDRAFWSRYLTMLATHRFNRFNLAFGLGYDFTNNITDCYFHFAYPFLLSVPGYNVRANPLTDAERDSNLEMLKFISNETARRGMQFQLGLWTHAYQWTGTSRANYTIEGLTPETQAPYCRDALRTLLNSCPAISGVTIRTHGESGVAEGNYDLWKTIFDGVAQCGRKVEIDLHAKGMDQGIIDSALATGQPLVISPKFWAEHMGLPYMQGAIRPQEMPPRNSRDSGFFGRSTGSRSFLRYGYGDLFAEDRRFGVLHRIWPGTQRVLLWGDPEMTAAYGRVANFCGSKGVELMEPLWFKGRKGSGLPGGRDAYADASLRPHGGDFEKYEYTYRLWGRSLFNPDGDKEGGRRLLQHEFGRAAEPVENALASASRILPLVTTAHCPSAANNNYWPEMYYNMPMVESDRRFPYSSDTPNPKRFGTVSPLDPEFFLSCDQFADELVKGKSSGKHSPIWVAEQLEGFAEQAATGLGKAKAKLRNAQSVDFRRLAADVTIQAALGKFYAAKFRAGVLYALYLQTHDRGTLESAIAAAHAARNVWRELAAVANGVYRDDVTFGPEYFQRGHWLDRLSAMDEDLADLDKVHQSAEQTSSSPADASSQLAVRLAKGSVRSTDVFGATPIKSEIHTPERTFRRGQPVKVSAGKIPSSVAGISLRYRRINQAEMWQAIDMQRAGANYEAVIPAEYTNSPYPLQYHFQIRGNGGAAWLYPGLKPGWQGQPYYVVRQAK
jgi:hypothetical protein